MSPVTCHMTVTCHVSPVTCHLSLVTCHLSPVTWPPLYSASPVVKVPRSLAMWLCTAVLEAWWIVGLLQWKIVFKLPIFYLISKWLLVFFSQRSFGWPVLASERVLRGSQGVPGPFQRSKLGPTVQKSCALAIKKKIIKYEHLYLNLP